MDKAKTLWNLDTSDKSFTTDGILLKRYLIIFPAYFSRISYSQGSFENSVFSRTYTYLIIKPKNCVICEIYSLSQKKIFREFI